MDATTETVGRGEGMKYLEAFIVLVLWSLLLQTMEKNGIVISDNTALITMAIMAGGTLAGGNHD